MSTTSAPAAPSRTALIVAFFLDFPGPAGQRLNQPRQNPRGVLKFKNDVEAVKGPAPQLR